MFSNSNRAKKTMTIEEAKNKVAQNKGYLNWTEFYDWIARPDQFPCNVAQQIESAMTESINYIIKSREKNIDIPDDIVKDLKKMAIDADKDLKNFIQDYLILLVRGEKKEQKLPQRPDQRTQGAIEHNGRCYAFGFACRSYQLSMKLSAKLTYSTGYKQAFI